MPELNVDSFKAYDIRGRVPDVLSSSVAYALGRAYATFLNPESVVVGHDIRLSSPEICGSLIEGLLDSGVNVSHIGCCGTEEIYFSTDHYGFDGGIIVTASHNPGDYNGMKLVREKSRPISSESGLIDIKELVRKNSFPSLNPDKKGTLSFFSHREDYVRKILEFISIEQTRGFKILANAGNGAAGPVLETLREHLECELIVINGEPDGNFPNGVPNPLLPENRRPTENAVKEVQADFGVAWDGDFDRCFFFDETGRFVEGYYIVGLLAQALLEEKPAETIIYDSRLTWNTIDMVGSLGRTVQSKAGHSFIKEKLRLENAIYGGEMSGHHYFKEFSYCDSGMIPWLLVVGLLAKNEKSLSEIVKDRISLFPCSEEINCNVNDSKTVLSHLKKALASGAERVDLTDGVSMEFKEWRFNVRPSNTEQLLRLNVEARSNRSLMEEKSQLILSIIKGVS